MKLLLTLLILLIAAGGMLAQDSAATVPDLAGLNVPQAAAALNRAGLVLGTEVSSGWTAESGLPQNTISGQSAAPGTQLAPGTPVDVSVLRSPNVELVYDDNDLTVVNLTGGPVDLRGLVFTTTEGAQAVLAASRWGAELRGNQCMQVWSVGRNGPKEVGGCRFIQNWFSTTNRGEHFWTQTSGALAFTIIENGVARATCPAAPLSSQDNPIRCQAYLSGGGAESDVTQFVYFVYTPETIALINASTDRWMPANQTRVRNYNPNIAIPGVPVVFGDPDLLPDQFRTGYGDVTRLAPGQCLLLTTLSPADAEAPEACDVIAVRDLLPTVAFWLADFEVESAVDGQRRTCPAAIAEQITVCVMPR